jgi:cation transport protein ChaC
VTGPPPDPLWIFGYGSLVWRPSFPHSQQRPARLLGWARRFWQGSTDHRGVPGAPGRVVTLVREPEAVCWGMAYRVAASERQAILARLDHRERGGYERLVVRLEARGGEAIPALVYLATSDNPNYLGPAPMERIAEQVRVSHGPSGSNLEYVQRLAAALRGLGAEDDHVFALDGLVSHQGPQRLPGGDQVATPNEPKR